MPEHGLLYGIGVSLRGILIVFCVLLALAVLTVIAGKILELLFGGRRQDVGRAAASPASGPAAVRTADSGDVDQTLAILHAVLSAESGIPADRMVITSVKERIPAEF